MAPGIPSTQAAPNGGLTSPEPKGGPLADEPGGAIWAPELDPGERDAQVRRLRIFVRCLLVPFFLFGPFDLWTWYRYGDASSGILAAVILSLIPLLLWALAELRHNRLERAATITIAALLVPAFGLVFVRPFLYPVLAVGTLLATVVALPFVRRKTLVRLLGVAFADAVAICVFGAILLPPSQYYVPGSLRAGLTAASLSAVLGLTFVMAGLFSTRLTETLDRTRNAHERLAETHAELRALDRRRSEFMSATAHEIFTPLTPIRIQLHLLQRDGDLTSSQRASLQMIERSFVRLSHLAGDLLDTTRVEAGKLHVGHAPVRLAQVAGDALELHRQVADSSGVRLSGQFDDGVIVGGDEQRLAQVLDNLINNALKFTPRGGTVHVEVSGGRDEAEISVSDSGIGVEPKDQDRLFRPFSQLGSKDRGGTGLGLFISKGIVEAHGGRIGLESEGAGQGTRIVIRLPRIPTPASMAEAEPIAAAF